MCGRHYKSNWFICAATKMNRPQFRWWTFNIHGNTNKWKLKWDGWIGGNATENAPSANECPQTKWILSYWVSVSGESIHSIFNRLCVCLCFVIQTNFKYRYNYRYWNSERCQSPADVYKRLNEQKVYILNTFFVSALRTGATCHRSRGTGWGSWRQGNDLNFWIEIKIKKSIWKCLDLAVVQNLYFCKISQIWRETGFSLNFTFHTQL